MAFGGARKMQNATLAVGLIGFLRFGMLGRNFFAHVSVITEDWSIAGIIALVSILSAFYFDKDRKKSYVFQDWLIGGFGGLIVGGLLSQLIPKFLA
jgi:hypothetical protein